MAHGRRPTAEQRRLARQRSPAPRRPWSRRDFYEDAVYDLLLPAGLLFAGAVLFAWTVLHLRLASSFRLAGSLTAMHLLVRWLVFVLLIPPLGPRMNVQPWPAMALKFAAIAVLPDAVGLAMLIWAGGPMLGLIAGISWAAVAAWLMFGLLLGVDMFDAKILSAGSCAISGLMFLGWWLLA